jgi:hypothetical protein
MGGEPPADRIVTERPRELRPGFGLEPMGPLPGCWLDGVEERPRA